MLCEVDANFFALWAMLTALAAVSSLFVFSGSAFYYLYVRATYEKWVWKTNPEYPKPEKVRDEIVQMLKGLLAGAACPALSLYFARHKIGKAYCGVGEYGWGYLVFSFFLHWIVVDLFEFAYHWFGHKFDLGWEHHRFHHVFPNPTPFAVIADEYTDMLVRSSPLLLFPLVVPLNMDMVWFTFSVMFYGYGTYLHLGHEAKWLPADHPWINTSFQHNLHHSNSIKNKPFHTGFFFKIWDQLCGTTAVDGIEKSALRAQQRGERTRGAWERVQKPDYRVLLSPSFWHPRNFAHTGMTNLPKKRA